MIKPSTSQPMNVPEPAETIDAGIVKSFYSSLSSNPYFSAGAGLFGIGAAAAFSRRIFILANTLFRRRFLSSLELDNEDCAYSWVLDYINKQSMQRTNRITVNTWLQQAESGKTTTSFYFLPGRGEHFFWYNKRLVKVERNRERHTIQKMGVRTPLETVTLTTFGGNPTFWKDFLDKAAQDSLSKVETGLVIYNAVGPEWHRFGNPRRKRPISSVVLEDQIAERLISDFDEFLNSEKWYVNRGVPYRRGYLLYGPPGTGKSSFISALAGHYGYSICMVSLSERTLDDDRLNHLLNNTPKNSILLLEDVDAAMPSSRTSDENETTYEGLTRVTMSGLLNAIDGVASSEGRLLFMTTNHVERLDQALVRPGRIDVKQYFGHCTPKMARTMFQNFYEDVSKELSNEFEEKAKFFKQMSPAQIQGHFLIHKQNPEKAIAALKF
ncbi:ATPase family associated with various cellular activities (AAA) domain-containing protein [Ditylenchus destructor]|nr:ATPase family associated with various cellular activities (AAA) domain-containing protein [Ditylenchus destructor]